jgi:hypothetical protein
MAWRFPHDHIQGNSRKISKPSIDGVRLQRVKRQFEVIESLLKASKQGFPTSPHLGLALKVSQDNAVHPYFY